MIGSDGGRAPLCFLHVPKCAGTSLHEALEAALPDGAVSARRIDPCIFSFGFSDFDSLDEQPRSLVAVGDSELAELAAHRVVSGHFALPTLRRLAPVANVATILREPRARLLSWYMFLRLTPTVELWQPYGGETLERLMQSIERCLSEPAIGRATDNQACRLVLHGDPRMPADGFVTPEDAPGLAAAALERLDELGFVGLLEFDDLWGSLSRFFGASLEPTRVNVSGTAYVPEGALPIPPFDMATVLDLVEQRTRADRLVYIALLERRCGSAAQARRIADAAFASELVHFGDVTGSAATRLEQLGLREEAV